MRNLILGKFALEHPYYSTLPISVFLSTVTCRAEWFLARLAIHRDVLVGVDESGFFGRLTVVITHIEDFPFLDCYTSSHATPDHPGNPQPCAFGQPYPGPSAVLHCALPHRAAGICSIDTDGGGSGGMADGQACAHDAD